MKTYSSNKHVTVKLVNTIIDYNHAKFNLHSHKSTDKWFVKYFAFIYNFTRHYLQSLTTAAHPQNASPKQRQRQIEDGHHRDDPDTSRSLMSRGSSRSHMSMSAVGVKRGPTVASSRRPLPSAQWEPPPWRGSDPNPIDTQR